MLADVIILIYEVPYIFWHYINVESLSKNYYKVRRNYYKFRQLSLLQSATRFIEALLGGGGSHVARLNLKTSRVGVY